MKFHVYRDGDRVTIVPLHRTNLHVPYPEDQHAFGYVSEGCHFSRQFVVPSQSGRRVAFASLPASLQAAVWRQFGLSTDNSELV
jgi:hypothetical protein